MYAVTICWDYMRAEDLVAAEVFLQLPLAGL